MSTTQDYIEFVCSQIAQAGKVRPMKMMGEYIVYVDDKSTLLVCNNTVYVKMLPCAAELLKGAEHGIPYKGAKEHYILDIDNQELSAEVARLVSKNTPLPKKKGVK